jgi:hypothetical protein
MNEFGRDAKRLGAFTYCDGSGESYDEHEFVGG